MSDSRPTTRRRFLQNVAAAGAASQFVPVPRGQAQRLARRLCEHCKQPDDLAREALLKEGFSEADLQGDWRVYKAVGCDKCTKGYECVEACPFGGVRVHPGSDLPLICDTCSGGFSCVNVCPTGAISRR